MEGVDQDGKV